jgi:hypothetical protein
MRVIIIYLLSQVDSRFQSPNKQGKGLNNGRVETKDRVVTATKNTKATLPEPGGLGGSNRANNSALAFVGIPACQWLCDPCLSGTHLESLKKRCDLEEPSYLFRRRSDVFAFRQVS